MVGLRQYQWGRTVGSVSYLSGHRSHPKRSGEPTCGRHSLQRPKAEASSHEAVCVYIGGALPPDLLTDPVFSLSPEHGYVSCGTTVIHGLFHSRFR